MDQERKEKKTYRPTERYRRLMNGEISIDDLDDEEIIHGQLRNKRGGFGGNHPKMIPWEMHQALQRAMSSRMERKMIGELPEVIETLFKIVKAPGGDTRARVDAAKFLIERAIGKTPDVLSIEQTLTHTWEAAAQSGTLFVDVDPAAPLELTAGETPRDQDYRDDVDEPAFAKGPDIVEAEIVEEFHTGAIENSTPTEVPQTRDRPRPRPRPRPRVRTGNTDRPKTGLKL